MHRYAVEERPIKYDLVIAGGEVPDRSRWLIGRGHDNFRTLAGRGPDCADLAQLRDEIRFGHTRYAEIWRTIFPGAGENLVTATRYQSVWAEVPSGLDRAKARTLVENANTLNFIEKSVE
jgi:hypothetical protein